MAHHQAWENNSNDIPWGAQLGPPNETILIQSVPQIAEKNKGGYLAAFFFKPAFQIIEHIRNFPVQWYNLQAVTYNFNDFGKWKRWNWGRLYAAIVKCGWWTRCMTVYFCFFHILFLYFDLCDVKFTEIVLTLLDYLHAEESCYHQSWFGCTWLHSEWW